LPEAQGGAPARLSEVLQGGKAALLASVYFKRSGARRRRHMWAGHLRARISPGTDFMGRWDWGAAAGSAAGPARQGAAASEADKRAGTRGTGDTPPLASEAW